MFVFICILVSLLLVKWYMVVVYIPPLKNYGADVLANIEYTQAVYTKIESKPIFHSPISTHKKDDSRQHKNKKKPNPPKKSISNKKLLFDFNPNTLCIDSLILLGFSKYAAKNIVKYRGMGGHFRHATDLQKIYGIDSITLQEVNPYIKIIKRKQIQKPKKSSKVISVFKKIDINLADTTDFKSLKGIGTVYANRIVKFRNSLGGYFTIDQIKEVWGLSDSLYTAIKPHLMINPLNIKKRNINLIEKEMLVKHPYIDWKKAKYIISYKKMHGAYKSMDDFEKLHGLEKEFVDTLKQYFITQ